MNEVSPQRFRIAGMDCGSCALTIESALRQLPGVSAATVSFATESAEVSGQIETDLVDRTLRQLGYRLADAPATSGANAANTGGVAGFLRFCRERRSLRIAMVLGAVCALAAALPALGADSSWPQYAFLLAAIVAGAPVLLKGLRALWFTRRVTIDLLMGVAALGAIAIGATGEAATVVLLYTLGEALEGYSAAQARKSLGSIVALQPQEAIVLESHAGGAHEDKPRSDTTAKSAAPDTHQHGESCAGQDHDHGHEHAEHEAPVAVAAQTSHVHTSSRPVSQVRVGDLVLVRPGQRIPLDGRVEDGESSVDESTLTGESIPVPKLAGAAVMAGTINHEGALQIRVTQAATDSTIARIARLVEQAQAQRSPAERWVDRFAHWYTPAVVLLAILTVVVPVWGFGAPLLDSVAGEHGWLYRGLALLIIACPCALVISIPVTVVSALTRLAHLGVLVRGGAQLDTLADVRAIALDKTGTLTLGRPAVTVIRAVDCSHAAEVSTDCDQCDEVVAVAATVEVASEHPIAHAILDAAAQRGVRLRYPQATSVRARLGFGVLGQWRDGSIVAVGSRAMFPVAEGGFHSIAQSVEAVHGSGNTVMLVARNSQVLGYVGVQDQLRDTSREAVSQIRGLPDRPRLFMLTGDSLPAAQRVAMAVGGLDEVRAGLLPEGKLAAITELKQRYGTLAMVGDGINDAPALARADVGVSLGRAGSTQAIETADVVLMHDDLRQLPSAIRIARRMRRVVKENIALSLGLKLAFLALAIPGIATLWMAVVADVVTTLLVTLNGMRLLRES